VRILHTADWHLGKILHGVPLLEDQAHVLEQICAIAEAQKPDVILIAGDLYDRSVPPADAVRLLSDTLGRLVALGVPVLVIAGNHDAPDRLEFGAGIFAQHQLHIVGHYRADAEPIRIEDDHGPVDFYLLPYLHPSAVRIELDDDSFMTHEAATAAALKAWESRWDADTPGARKVLAAHAFVEGGSESDSERPLMVGGSGTVPSGVFDSFDYVALGHLHAPQTMGRSSICYSGSIMKYSLSEVEHSKSVSLVDVGPEGEISVEQIPLRARRDLRRITGKLQTLLDNPPLPGTDEDYIVATLLDKTALLDPMGRLREIFPNILAIERPHLERRDDGAELSREDLKQDDADLFASFFQQVTGEKLLKSQRTAFTKVAEEILAEVD